MSLPATKMRPLVGRSSLLSRRMKVDLPDPDGPTRKTNSPFWMSRRGVAERDDVALVVLGDVLEPDHRRGDGDVAGAGGVGAHGQSARLYLAREGVGTAPAAAMYSEVRTFRRRTDRDGRPAGAGRPAHRR